MQIEPLTLQAYLNSQWQDIAILEFEQNYHVSQLTYLYDLTEILQDNCYAVSLNLPVSLYPIQSQNGWFHFLDDIIPSGASRRYWLKQLDISHLPVFQQNYLLLKQGTISPVGHLRIKQAVENVPNSANERLFNLKEVIERYGNFLDYANQRGAMAGGATGAGGEAPKLLLRRTAEDKIWIDNHQLGNNFDDYYLVKFPRGKRSKIDCDILRAEYHYYQELTAIGFQTIVSDKMRLEEGDHYPSLWLPRFDIYQDQQGNSHRYAMESVYSMLQKGAGSQLDHEQTIRQIITKIEQSYLVESGFIFDKSTFIYEWLKRDLLNIAFGNSDNHGRNTAFLRNDRSIWLEPIYDFAPMKADPDGIIRLTTWSSKTTPPLELGGEYYFEGIIEQLSDLCDPKQSLAQLQQTATKLIGLKERLQKRGVPKSILTFPAIGFDYLEEKLQRWKLI